MQAKMLENKVAIVSGASYGMGFSMAKLFAREGATAFARDLPDARIIPVESGHFALENCCKEIAEYIRDMF